MSRITKMSARATTMVAGAAGLVVVTAGMAGAWSVVASIPISSYPQDVAVNSTGSTAYVSWFTPASM